jgi:hypothetical protein
MQPHVCPQPVASGMGCIALGTLWDFAGSLYHRGWYTLTSELKMKPAVMPAVDSLGQIVHQVAGRSCAAARSLVSETT